MQNQNPGDFLAHAVIFGDFMAGNFLAGDFLGGYRKINDKTYSQIKFCKAV